MISYTQEVTNNISLKAAKEISIKWLEKQVKEDISPDGFLMEYECVSYHNNDYEWRKTGTLADPQLFAYNEALKVVLKQLKGEEHV